MLGNAQETSNPEAPLQGEDPIPGRMRKPSEGAAQVHQAERDSSKARPPIQDSGDTIGGGTACLGAPAPNSGP